MSKRGLQYNHDVGEHVLCFEPDPKKVKVIYPAKVMEHTVRKHPETAQRVAAYRIHFQGWKASWDREVTESMLLPDTMFNRELMFRIDEITRRTRRIEEVRERIDLVLNHVRRIRESGQLSTEEEENAFDWGQVEGIMPPLPPAQDNRNRKDRGTSLKSSTDAPNDSDDEEADPAHVENLDMHNSFMQSLQLSNNLRRVLEADQRRVEEETGDNAISASEPTVVRFLEDYLLHFATRPARMQSQAPQQAANSGPAFWAEEYARADRSLRLAFEVCNSLRSLFDVFLYDDLLYNRERPVHRKDKREASATARRRSAAAAVAALQHNAAGSDSVQQHAPSAYGQPVPYSLLPPEVKAQRQLPSCLYPPIYLLRLFVILPDLLDSMDLTLCRRAIISRHVVRVMKYMENSISSWFSYPVDGLEEEDVRTDSKSASHLAPSLVTNSSRRRKRAAHPETKS